MIFTDNFRRLQTVSGQCHAAVTNHVLSCYYSTPPLGVSDNSSVSSVWTDGQK